MWMNRQCRTHNLRARPSERNNMKCLRNLVPTDPSSQGGFWWNVSDPSRANKIKWKWFASAPLQVWQIDYKLSSLLAVQGWSTWVCFSSLHRLYPPVPRTSHNIKRWYSNNNNYYSFEGGTHKRELCTVQGFSFDLFAKQTLLSSAQLRCRRCMMIFIFHLLCHRRVHCRASQPASQQSRTQIIRITKCYH